MDPALVLGRCRPLSGWPVFAIGVKESGVTVASQQRRAIHLIDALRMAGVAAAGSRIAIVGAGAAGLTAAARAAKSGIHAVVLERDDDLLLPTLAGNRTRLVHPNLYSWPDDGWQERRAMLPLLTWSADRAGVVADTISRGFREIERETGLIELKPGATITWSWPLPRHGDHVELSWTTKRDGAARGRFAAVILAVGFGHEEGTGRGTRFPGYWQDDWVEQAAGSDARKYFIHGSGDGGLTDLSFACASRVSIRMASKRCCIAIRIRNASSS